jgi:hypothetical protein
MFGELRAGVKNLLAQANNWRKPQTFTINALGTTTSPIQNIVNTTPSTVAANVQVSPSIFMRGSALKQDSITDKTVDFIINATPISLPTSVEGAWKIRSSIASATPSDLLTLYTRNPDGNPGGSLQIEGSATLQNTWSNQDPATSRSLNIVNTAGQYSNLAFTFGSTVKSAITVGNDGTTQYKTISNSGHFFMLGGSISSQSLMLEIYGGGMYCAGGSFNQGSVTAGNANTSPPAVFSNFGSRAAKGIDIVTASYTLANEEYIYADASSSSFCSGTHTACSTYGDITTCGNHTTAGCSWFTGTACTTYDGTDQTTCESGHSPCSWTGASCSVANNTDSTTCSNLNGSYGGSCSWDTGACPSISVEATCSGTSGCTWNYSNCNAFDNTPQGTCEANAGCVWTGSPCSSFNNTTQATCETSHTGCAWTAGAFDCHTQDGTDQATCEGNTGCAWNSGDNTCYNLCDGTYYESSTCVGQYNTSCTGDLCTGSYYTGNCGGGSWGASCTGTASCAPFVTSGTCAAEASGCSWITGATYTLPSAPDSGGTARLYKIKRIGATGTVNVIAGAGDTLESAIALTAQYQGVSIHFHRTYSSCDIFGDETTCSSNAGCSWNPAIVCSSFTDEPTCASNSGSGCSWSGSTCSGAGAAAYCSGTYTSARKWYKHAVV